MLVEDLSRLLVVHHGCRDVVHHVVAIAHRAVETGQVVVNSLL